MNSTLIKEILPCVLAFNVDTSRSYRPTSKATILRGLQIEIYTAILPSR